jgi:hypothetical protein
MLLNFLKDTSSFFIEALPSLNVLSATSCYSRLGLTAMKGKHHPMLVSMGNIDDLQASQGQSCIVPIECDSRIKW